MSQSLSKKILECREKIIRNISILGLIKPATVEILDSTFNFNFWLGNAIRVSPNDQYNILNESDCRRIISDLNYVLRNRYVISNSIRENNAIKLLLEIGRLCFYLILDHAGMTEIPDLWCEEESAELNLVTGKAHDFIEILSHLYDQFNLQNESVMAREAVENTYCVLSLAKAYEIVRLWDRMDAQMRNLLQSYLKDMESHITDDIPSPSVDLWTIGSPTNSYEDMLEKRKENILETLRGLIKESEDKKENKEDANMESITKNMFDGMMQKVTGVAMTMNGEIAVKSGDSYKTYDQKKGCLVNVTGLTLPGSDGLFFTIPSTKVNVGDLIFISAEKPVFVTEVSSRPKRITVVNYATNEVSTIVPETYLFMGSTYFFKKIVCPFGNMFGKGNKGMMKMMMFQSMFNNQNQEGAAPISSSGPNMMNLGSMMNWMIMKSCFGNDSNFDFLDFDDTGIDFSEDTKADMEDDKEDAQVG